MTWFHNLKISSKLLIGFILVALVSGVVGYVGITQIKTIAAADVRMYEKTTIPITQLNELNREFQTLRVTVRDLLLSRSASEASADNESLNKIHENITDILLEYEKSVSSAEEKTLYVQFARRVEEYYSYLEQFGSIISAGRKDEALTFMRGNFQKHAQQMEIDLGKLREGKIAFAKETLDKNNLLAKDASLTMTLFMVSGMILAIGLGFFISSVVGKPLREMTIACNNLAVGDLDQVIHVKSKDEVGNLADGFRKIIDAQKEMAGTAIRIAEGDLNVQVELRSDKDTLAQAMQKVLKSLNGLVEETVLLTQAGVEGHLSTRGHANKFQGAYKSIITGMNDTLDSVTAPINEAMKVLQVVASRDLTVRVTGNYKGDFTKIKDSLNLAIQNLEEALSQFSMGSEQVTTAAQEISSGSQTLSQGASEQASTLEEISSSLQEMSSMTRQNTHNAKQAQSITEEAKLSTARGVDSMKRLSSAIDQIKESSDSTAKIIKTIDEIAFQTNLLALNAAVEAARAGDAGKGFAVVAEEVRNLAMRSAEAAKNTANLIEESVKKAEGGVTINQEVLTNLTEISEQVHRVREVMSDIVAASDQQSQGIEQVNTAVIQMNQVTQQTAANAEESASSAEELSSQAVEMKSMVQSFQLSRNSAAGRSKASLNAGTANNVPRPAFSKNSNALSNHSQRAENMIPYNDDSSFEANDFQF
jgi:methyl-accepting chemotaxis protein